jgi:hypothetical protein
MYNFKGNIIVIGDVNINIMVSSNDSDHYPNLMSSLVLACLIDSPTRVTGNSGFARLYKMCSHDLQIEVLHEAITDHSLIRCSICVKEPL